jgi:peroxiredoxin
MNRRGSLFVLFAGVVAAALGLAANWWRSEPAGVSADATAALFAATFADVDGVSRPLAQWSGRPLVVNFWATWCPPCVEEMPDLQLVRDEYQGQGVEIIGVGIDSAPKIAAFRSQHQLTLPLLVAGAGGSDLYRALGNSRGVLPFTVLIDARGHIRQRHVGQLKPEQLRTWLDGLLAHS